MPRVAWGCDRPGRAEDRQARDFMLRSFQVALKTGPSAAATIMQQNAPPPNMSRADFNKWMAPDKGIAWQHMFQSVLDQGAMDSMWTHVPFSDKGDIAALNSGEVGLHRIAFDKNGQFAGMTDADGDTAYPNKGWYFPGTRYNMAAANSVSPQYLKWLQEGATQRNSVPRQ